MQRTSSTGTINTTMEPKQVVTLPTIVKETIIPQETTEVQPVIHRDRELTEVHKITQPMHERDIAPTQLQYSTLPTEMRPTMVMQNTEFQQQPSANVQPSLCRSLNQPTGAVYQRPPIVEETIHKRIIEEVQPVLYKEVVRPTVITQTRPIHETVVDTPTIFNEQQPLRDLGTRYLDRLPQQNISQQPQVGLPGLPPQPQVGLPGLPPRDVRPSLDLLGDNTGYGRSTGIGSQAPGSNLSQSPTTGMAPVVNEGILKVEYEIFNVEPTSYSQPYVERTVTKVIETVNVPTGSNIGKASSISPP